MPDVYMIERGGVVADRLRSPGRRIAVAGREVDARTAAPAASAGAGGVPAATSTTVGRGVGDLVLELAVAGASG